MDFWLIMLRKSHQQAAQGPADCGIHASVHISPLVAVFAAGPLFRARTVTVSVAGHGSPYSLVTKSIFCIRRYDCGDVAFMHWRG